MNLSEDNIYDLSFDYQNVPKGTKLFFIEADKFLGPLLLSGTDTLVQRVSGESLTLEIIFPTHDINNIKFNLSKVSLYEQINPSIENELYSFIIKLEDKLQNQIDIGSNQYMKDYIQQKKENTTIIKYLKNKKIIKNEFKRINKNIKIK